MFSKKKQWLCEIISLCLLFSTFCFGNIETGLFGEQKNWTEKSATISIECLSADDDIYLHQNIKETTGNSSNQAYSKNRKSSSNNLRVLFLGFSNHIIAGLFLLFFIWHRVNSENINLSLVNILRFIHDKDGKK